MKEKIGNRTINYQPVSIVTCARCGEDHTKLMFREFLTPIEDANGRWMYWAICPKNHEPVLMRIVDDDGEVQDGSSNQG